jgi:hypothetical protein
MYVQPCAKANTSGQSTFVPDTCVCIRLSISRIRSIQIFIGIWKLDFSSSINKSQNGSKTKWYRVNGSQIGLNFNPISSKASARFKTYLPISTSSKARPNRSPPSYSYMRPGSLAKQFTLVYSGTRTLRKYGTSEAKYPQSTLDRLLVHEAMAQVMFILGVLSTPL